MEKRDLGLLVTGLLLTTGHWFPWPKPLHRLAAYAYGVASILAGQALWLLPEHADTWWGLVAFAVVGGLATGLCYLVDWIHNLAQRAKVRHDSDEC